MIQFVRRYAAKPPEGVGRAVRSLCIALLVFAWPAAASELSPAPPPDAPDPDAPDPEFLEFLGETAGMDPEVVKFMDSREAKRAVKDAAAKKPEEEGKDDE
jgi:hypothetical protein